jgi:hypothetical protein
MSETLAKLFLEDRQARVGRQRYVAPICVACGRSYHPPAPGGDNSIRFCGRTCREAYDGGFTPEPPFDPFSVKRWKVIVGNPGALNAAGYPIDDRRKARTDCIPNEELIRPRRPCLRCGGNMPVWIRGKRVSKTRKFCPGCTH